jgi:hypothetical protein
MRGPSFAILLAVLLGTQAWADFTDVLDVRPSPAARLFAPGPRRLRLDGLQVDPSTILDFDGTVALGYLLGTATDGNGRSYRLVADMRVMRGDYISTDAVRKAGTFGFI